MSFNILMIVQAGRLSAEAVLALASLREVGTDETRITFAEPQPGPLWDHDPRVQDSDVRTYLTERGARIVPLHNKHFGSTYPYGNKIEALALLPSETPFVFFDTDTLFLKDPQSLILDFERPAASLRRSPSWPKVESEAEREVIWRDLYARFGLTLEIDSTYPPGDWQRIPYFNAGWFFGSCPQKFGARFVQYATAIKANPGEALAGQTLSPWLDQIALPLVISAEGGVPRQVEGLDGDVTCHYRTLPLLFARENAAVTELVQRLGSRNRVKKLLKRHPAFHHMLYRGGAEQVKALFADGAPADEAVLRKELKAAGLWLR